MISATEARKQSEKNAADIALKNSIEKARKNDLAKRAKEARHKKWYKDFIQDVEISIDCAIQCGGRKVKRTLISERDSVSANKKYQDFEYKKELDKVVKFFSEEHGYTATVDFFETEHDESASYMNSGGECGSETPYWTCDVIFKVSW